MAQSVIEGELPEDTNVDAVANLCLPVSGGLTFRVIDGSPKGLLFRSIELFVNGLGFFPQKIIRSQSLESPPEAEAMTPVEVFTNSDRKEVAKHESSCHPRIRRTSRTEI
jgi:hypothetical protein